MKISVVIPAHNSERWIAESLESVFAQTRQPDEVIVVNDASTDGTEERVRAFSPDIHVINTQHRNAAAARNEGVRAASGDYVAFLDADDWWESGHLRRAMEHLVPSGDVAFIGHYGHYFESSKKFCSVDPLREKAECTRLTSDQFLSMYAARNPGWTTCSMVIRRARFLEAGGFDPNRGPGSPTGATGQESAMQRLLEERGCEPWCLPNAVLWHWVPASRCSEEWAIERAYRVAVEHVLGLGNRSALVRRPVRSKLVIRLRNKLRPIKPRSTTPEERNFQLRFYSSRDKGLLAGIDEAHRFSH